MTFGMRDGAEHIDTSGHLEKMASWFCASHAGSLAGTEKVTVGNAPQILPRDFGTFQPDV